MGSILSPNATPSGRQTKLNANYFSSCTFFNKMMIVLISNTFIDIDV